MKHHYNFHPLHLVPAEVILLCPLITGKRLSLVCTDLYLISRHKIFYYFGFLKVFHRYYTERLQILSLQYYGGMEAVWKIKDKLKWYMSLCLDLICAWRYFDLNYQIYCSFIRGSCSQLILSYSGLTSWNMEQVKLFMTQSVSCSCFGLKKCIRLYSYVIWLFPCFV